MKYKYTLEESLIGCWVTSTMVGFLLPWLVLMEND